MARAGAKLARWRPRGREAASILRGDWDRSGRAPPGRARHLLADGDRVVGIHHNSASETATDGQGPGTNDAVMDVLRVALVVRGQDGGIDMKPARSTIRTLRDGTSSSSPHGQALEAAGLRE